MTVVLAPYWSSGSERRRLFARHGARWKDEGLQFVLADDGLQASDLPLFLAAIPLPPPESVGQALAVLRNAPVLKTVEAVLIATEAALPVGSLLALHLGVPAIKPAAALSTLDKLRTRRILDLAGVPIPAFASVRTEAEVIAFGGRFGWPCLLKARASTMGRLMQTIRGPREVRPAVAALAAALPISRDIHRLCAFSAAAEIELESDPRANFLVEKVVDGEPLEVDGVVSFGRFSTFGVISQRLTPPPAYFIEAYRLPADLPPAEAAYTERVAESALSAMGLTDSGFSIELRRHPEGARVIEVNGRLGEDDAFAELFQEASGLEPLLLALDVALGREARCVRPIAAWSLTYRGHYTAGCVLEVPSEEILRTRPPGIHLQGLAVAPGDELFAATDPRIFPHLAYALASHPTSSAAADRIAEEALTRWRLTVGLPPRVDR